MFPNVGMRGSTEGANVSQRRQGASRVPLRPTVDGQQPHVVHEQHVQLQASFQAFIREHPQSEQRSYRQVALRIFCGASSAPQDAHDNLEEQLAAKQRAGEGVSRPSRGAPSNHALNEMLQALLTHMQQFPQSESRKYDEDLFKILCKVYAGRTSAAQATRPPPVNLRASYANTFSARHAQARADADVFIEDWFASLPRQSGLKCDLDDCITHLLNARETLARKMANATDTSTTNYAYVERIHARVNRELAKARLRRGDPADYSGSMRRPTRPSRDSVTTVPPLSSSGTKLNTLAENSIVDRAKATVSIHPGATTPGFQKWAHTVLTGVRDDRLIFAITPSAITPAGETQAFKLGRNPQDLTLSERELLVRTYRMALPGSSNPTD